MISCWFSRHCFSLSSVSDNRCSRMETVCKINGGKAQRTGRLRAAGTGSSPRGALPGPLSPVTVGELLPSCPPVLTLNSCPLMLVAGVGGVGDREGK